MWLSSPFLITNCVKIQTSGMLWMGQRSEVSPPDAVLILSKGTNFKSICGSGDISCSWDWDKETFYSISRPLVTIMHFTHPTLLNKQKFQCDSKTFLQILDSYSKMSFSVFWSADYYHLWLKLILILHRQTYFTSLSLENIILHLLYWLLKCWILEFVIVDVVNITTLY